MASFTDLGSSNIAERIFGLKIPTLDRVTIGWKFTGSGEGLFSRRGCCEEVEQGKDETVGLETKVEGVDMEEETYVHG